MNTLFRGTMLAGLGVEPAEGGQLPVPTTIESLVKNQPTCGSCSMIQTLANEIRETDPNGESINRDLELIEGQRQYNAMARTACEAKGMVYHNAVGRLASRCEPAAYKPDVMPSAAEIQARDEAQWAALKDSDKSGMCVATHTWDDASKSCVLASTPAPASSNTTKYLLIGGAALAAFLLLK